jgi:uncharacterized membrane protein YkoI
MKHTIVTLSIILFMTLPIHAQTKESEERIKRASVPTSVLSAFEKSYPKAIVRGYSREDEGGKTVYEIESRDRGVNRDVSYDSDGNIVSIEESIQYAELPEPVRDTISRDYPKGKVIKSERLLKDSTTQFEVVVKSGKHTVELVYDSEGRSVSEEKK